MKRRISITTKLTLVFVLFAAALLGGIGLLTYFNGRAALQTAITAELVATSIEKEAALNAWVDDRHADIVALSRSPAVLEATAALDDPGGQRAALGRLAEELNQRIGAENDFLELFVMHPDTGEVIASTQPANLGEVKAAMPFFIRGRLVPFVQAPYYSPVLQAPAMTVAAPLTAPDGQLIGVLAGRLNLDELRAIIHRRTQLRQTDDTLVVNAAQQLVTRPRFMAEAVELHDRIDTEPVRQCLLQQTGSVLAGDYRGVPVIAAYRWLPEHELCLITKIDQSEAFAPVHVYTQQSLLIGGLGLVLASTFAVILARSITQPIVRLHSAATRISNGERRVQLPVSPNDELGQLSAAFNTMASTIADQEAGLRRYAEHLEQMVDDRTVALRQSEERYRAINITLEQRVRERTAQLEAALKELEAFSYSVSHDLRAPLRAIDGFARILINDYAPHVPAEAQRYLHIVRDSTSQMGRLIDDLLAFSRLNRQALSKEHVTTAEVVRSAFATLLAEREGRQVELLLDDLPNCLADPVLLRQVWMNLIENALKYTRRREVALIEVGWLARDGEDVFFIKDNGVGFDMRYASKLFGVFQRLHRASEYEGNGVGLATVQRIIHRHGGRVWAEARVDAGATFYFTLGNGKGDRND